MINYYSSLLDFAYLVLFALDPNIQIVKIIKKSSKYKQDL